LFAAKIGRALLALGPVICKAERGWGAAMVRWLSAGVSVFLVSCAAQIDPEDMVRSQGDAIAIGSRDCEDAAIRSRGVEDRWHASLAGDYWRVWFGSQYYDNAILSVLVAKRDGKTNGCALAF